MSDRPIKSESVALINVWKNEACMGKTGELQNQYRILETALKYLSQLCMTYT